MVGGDSGGSSLEEGEGGICLWIQTVGMEALDGKGI